MPKTPAKSTKAAKPVKKVGIPQTARGMHDILPAEQPYWDRVREVIRCLAEHYNLSRIDTPILEPVKLFEKGTGDTTDVVTKEMYTLTTKGGDALALRPEGTPSVARAYVEHGLSRLGQPQRLFMLGPMFRHDKPQQGRYRQFSQFDVEVLGGTSDPVYDAQVITIAYRFLQDLKVKSQLEINSIGCKVCRPTYKRLLQTYFKAHKKQLCENCLRRVDANPLRLLDCKEKKCVELRDGAPNILDKLCVTCSTHFKSVMEYLEELGIPCALNPHLVRGLDYYSRTVFEFVTDIGSLGGGGRYDYLLESMGGKATPAVGFACGIDRVIDVMKLQDVKLPVKQQRVVFVVHAGSLAKKKALALIEVLREAHIPAREALAKESLKAQLKVADKEGIPLALIVGQKEVYDGTVIIRDFKTGLQESFPLPRIVDEVKKRLREVRD